MPRYAALIPCYNVGKACIPVIVNAARYVQTCLVVDDGSTDETPQILAGLNVSNLEIIRHPKNLGKGAALLEGFRHLAEFEAIVTLDGDGQHDPKLIPQFSNLFERQEPHLIYGNRMMNLSGMPFARRLLNQTSNKIMSRICGQRIEDSQCGFRLYARKLIEMVINDLRTGRYVLETEILIQACRQGAKIAMIPISTIYSEQSNVLSHHSFYDVLRIARLMATYFFDRPKS